MIEAEREGKKLHGNLAAVRGCLSAARQLWSPWRQPFAWCEVADETAVFCWKRAAGWCGANIFESPYKSLSWKLKREMSKGKRQTKLHGWSYRAGGTDKSWAFVPRIWPMNILAVQMSHSNLDTAPVYPGPYSARHIFPDVLNYVALWTISKWVWQ